MATFPGPKLAAGSRKEKMFSLCWLHEEQECPPGVYIRLHNPGA